MHINNNKTSSILITLLLIISSVYCSKVSAQEKRAFLQHRYDGFSETISKNSTRKDLKNIKYSLERQGVIFSYSKLKYNSEKEIIRIFIKLRNKKSKFSSRWDQKNLPIPNLIIREVNGIVIIESGFDKLNINN